MKQLFYPFTFFLVLSFASCSNEAKQPTIPMNQLFAWCIVPFDSLQRTPSERIEMLSKLGFQQYAYDWREQHLPEMVSEWELAKQNNIDVMAVWMWIDHNQDTIGQLSANNNQVLRSIEAAGLNTQLWVSFHPNFFKDLSQEKAVEKGAAMFEYLCQRTDTLNLKIGLYNHGDWFGEPQNQIEILKALPDCNLGLIYNFHHGHHQIAAFDSLVDTMLPHLWAVNLNGMRQNGPKILSIGAGDLEQPMIQTLLNKGYKGPFGILGHREDKDVEIVLQKNLNGLFQWEDWQQ